MAEFVGSERIEMVGRLEQRLDALCRREDVPRVIVLEGPSGVGKSRIVREFYLALCRHLERGPRTADGSVPDGEVTPYWPALDETQRIDQPRADPLPARKQVSPTYEGFVWAPDAVPAFAWWGFACEEIDYAQADAATAAFEKWWDVHGRSMVWAWESKAGAIEALKRRGDTALEVFKEEFKEHAIHTVGKTLQELGIPTFGVGFVLNHAGKVANVLSDKRAHRSEAASDVTYATRYESQAEVIADALIKLARSDRDGDKANRLPVVVAIEDMHRLGPDLTALVRAIGKAGADYPVLLVGTAWPLGEAHARDEWLILRDEMLASGQMEVWDVPDLVQGDRESLVLSYAPNTDADIVASVAERWTNPLALELILTFKPLAENITGSGGALTLSANDLARLPVDVDDIYLARFNSLSSDVRQALVLARATLPDGGLGTAPFVRDVIGDAIDMVPGRLDPTSLSAQLLRIIRGEDVARLLGTAEEARWVRALRGSDVPGGMPDQEANVSLAQAFTEFQVAATVASQAPKVLIDPDAVVPVLRQAVVEVLSSRIDVMRDGGVSLEPAGPGGGLAAGWLLALAADSVPDPAALAVAQVHEGRRALAACQLGQAVRLLGAAVDSGALPGEAIDGFRVRRDLGRAFNESGRLEEASRLFAALCDEEVRALPEGHPEVMAARRGLAEALRDAGDLQAALTAYDAALAAVADGTEETSFRLRDGRAITLSRMGRSQDAIVEYEAILTDMRRAGSGDGLLAQDVRNNLGVALRDAGRLDDGLAVLEDLLVDTMRDLGPASPEAITVRANIATLKHDAGMFTVAHDAFSELVLDAESTFGPDHPRTLTVRCDVAIACASCGDLDQSEALHTSVLVTRQRVLGPDHPDTLLSRHQLAWLKSSRGLTEQALQDWDELLGDRLRVLGANHPDALRTRRNRAWAIRKVYSWRDALPEYKALAADSVRVLGPDNPETLFARGVLAWALAESGQAASSVEMYRALLEDRERLLGASHLDTLATRNALAWALSKAGEPIEAVATYRVLLSDYEALLADRTQRLGADHPDTQLMGRQVREVRRVVNAST